jgi:uncharacterized protein
MRSAINPVAFACIALCLPLPGIANDVSPIYCGEAEHPVEKIICSNNTLLTYDRDIAYSFRELETALSSVSASPDPMK